MAPFLVVSIGLYKTVWPPRSTRRLESRNTMCYISKVAASRFIWNEWNLEHIARHGVSPWEVEQLLAHPRVERRVRRGACAAYGQSDAGRHLLVVYRPREGGRIFVITARDMSAGEKRNYRRRRRS